MAPMGGSNDLALAGVAELGEELNQFDHNIDYLCTACGTGGTLAGLITSISSETKVIGFPALKGGDFLYEDINEFISSVKGRNSFPEWTLNLEYHFGGYAKKKPELMEFMALFNQKYNIELERIYTGKMMFGVFDMIKKGLFPKGSNIVALHSGGLQINRS